MSRNARIARRTRRRSVRKAGARTNTPRPIEIQKWSARFKESNLFFVLEAIAVTAGIAALGFTGWEFYQARLDREIAKQEREAEGIARAWAILAAVAPGNSGKKEALEYLASKGIALNGINMSCEAMGGVKDGKCLSFTYLAYANLKWPNEYRCMPNAIMRETNLFGASFENTTLSGSDFSFSDLAFVNFIDADLNEADFTGANLDRTEFKGANLGGAVFKEAMLYLTDFSDSNLVNATFDQTNLSGANFDGANISGVIFDEVDFYSKNRDNPVLEAQFNGVWAFTDKPPTGLPDEVEVCLITTKQFFGENPSSCYSPPETIGRTTHHYCRRK